MAAPLGYVLGPHAKHDFDAMRRAFAGTPRGIPTSRRRGSNTARSAPHRIVEVTEQPTAATWAGSIIVTAGTGKGKFRKMKSDGTELEGVEDDEITFLNYSTRTPAVGATEFLYRCQDLQGDDRAEPGWCMLGNEMEEVKGAFRLAGSVTPVTTASGTNQHFQFIHNDAECYDPIPHATIADTWHGVEIVRTGRHWISAYLEVNIASPTANDGTILMTDGVDLFSKVDNIQGTFALTANDGLGVLGDGAPALDSIIWTAMVFLSMNVHITFPGRMYWLEEGVQLQLYHEYPAAATKASISISYGFSGFYYGDFGTAWDPDAETP